MSSSSAALPLCMLGMMRLRTKAKIGGATRFRELVTLHPHHPLPGRGRARRMFWVQAKKGFAELLSQKRGFGGKKRSYGEVARAYGATGRAVRYYGKDGKRRRMSKNHMQRILQK